MKVLAPAERLHHEMRVRLAVPAAAIAAPLYQDASFALSADAFSFVTPGGVRFAYRRGDGVVAEPPPAALEGEFELYLRGTVFGAVAWLNGLFPLHASAVSVGDRAVAFTAPSGGGKSTLAAALAVAGHAHITDDTLPLALEGGTVMAIPDGKPLKLWQQAAGLSGLATGAAIDLLPGKYYADPPVREQRTLPLTDLFVLEPGSDLRISPIRGAAKLSIIEQAMYRPFVPAVLGDDLGHGRRLLELAQGIRVWRLARPLTPADRCAFDTLVRRVAGFIAAPGSAATAGDLSWAAD